MAKKAEWVSREQAIEELKAIGYWKDFELHLLPFSRKGLTRNLLNKIKEYVTIFGVKNTRHFIEYSLNTPAFKQLTKKLKSKTIATFKLMELFQEPLNVLLNDLRLKKAGYHLSLELHPTEPYFLDANRTKTAKFDFLVLNISNGPNKTAFASVYFSPFLNSKKEASAMLAHTHSTSYKKYGRDDFDLFNQKIGKPLFNYFTERLKKAFPSKTRILAVNPSRHSYHYPSETVVWLQLEDRGLITEHERFAYLRYSQDPEHYYGGVPLSRIKEIGKQFEAQKQWIISRSVGIHKSVFKKAGFKPEKSKRMFWRLK